MAVRLKPILPPKKIFDARKFDRAVDDGLRKTMNAGKGLFQRTTRNFRTVDVIFTVDVESGRGQASVGTNNRIYGFITHGTRPHLIVPVRAKFLVFGEGKYSPVTTPGKLGSRRVGTGLQGAGGVARPIFAKRVRHPGTKARRFEEEVAKRLQPILTANMKSAFLKGFIR